MFGIVLVKLLITIVQQGLLTQLLAIENLEINILRSRAENPLHQIIDAKWTINKSEQCLATFRHSSARQPFPIYGQIHQKAVLNILLRLLHQGNDPGNGRLPAVARPLHRGPAHWLRKHVVAERAQVPSFKRFQVYNRMIFRALCFGTDRVLEESFGAQAFDMCRLFLRANQHTHTQALHARIMLIQPQPLHVVMPLLP